MKRRVAWILPIVGLATSGCIFQTFEVSVQPFVTEAQVVDVPELEGFWVATREDDDEHPTTLDFRRGAGASWELVIGELGGGRSEVLLTRIGRIGDHLVWDLSPPPKDDGEVRAEHQLALHSVARVALEGGRFTVAFLPAEWIGKRIESGEFDLPYMTIGDRRRVLTAGNEELRAFVAGLDDAAFAESALSFERRERP